MIYLPTKRCERMNFSRQALLGTGMVIGGSVMLYAMAQQVSSNDKPAVAPVIAEQTTTEALTSDPLTIDVETEKRILAKKQKERAARVAAQEQRAKQFSQEQGAAEEKALAKARSENQQYLNNTNTGGDSDSPEAAQNNIPAPTVQARPESTANSTTAASNAAANDAKKAERKVAEEKAKAEKLKAEKAATKKLADSKKLASEKQQAEEKAAADKKAADTAAKPEPAKSAQSYTIKSGDGLQKLARQYNVSVAALAQANNIEPASTLQIGQVLTVPSRKEVERLEREAAAAKKEREAKLKKEQAEVKKSADAQKNLVAARKEVINTDAKGSFGVQVALATNQAKADAMAKKYKAAGYKVKTVNVGTGRGVRVIVGPERGKIAALALKDKVNSDPSVNSTEAWVRYWD